jgi:hypothetical protein
VSKAVLKLGKLLDSESESIQLKAALGIIEATIKLSDHEEWGQRLAALESKHEQSIKDKGAGAGGGSGDGNGSADILKTWVRP